MKLFEDLFNRNIRLTDERLEHIELDHPEMSGQIDKIAETLQNPEIVIKIRFGGGAFLSVLFGNACRRQIHVCYC
jgi:hypothetical protein